MAAGRGLDALQPFAPSSPPACHGMPSRILFWMPRAMRMGATTTSDGQIRPYIATRPVTMIDARPGRLRPAPVWSRRWEHGVGQLGFQKREDVIANHTTASMLGR